MEKLVYEEQLHKIFSNVNDWLKFAEAKNLGLLTLNAAIAFGFMNTNFEIGSVIQRAGYCVFPFLIISFISCLIPLLPIISKIESDKKVKDEDKNKKQKKQSCIKRFVIRLNDLFDPKELIINIHFYGYLKDLDKVEFEKEFLSKTGCTDSFTLYEQDIVDQILYNSRITWLKYHFFTIGANIFLSGIVFFAFSLLVIKFLF